METQEVQPVAVDRPAPTPKAIINQRYGSKACYKTEEVKEPVDNSCPGLVIPQHKLKSLYRCILDLPELSVTSEPFTRKKDAEQSAAKIAVEKLGIQSTGNDSSPEEALGGLVTRLSSFYTNEFLSSSHPLLGHFRVTIKRNGNLCGMIPLSAIAACDAKVNNLCKLINPKAESDPLLMLSILLKAARMSCSICTTDGEFWIQKNSPFSPETLELLTSCSSDPMECKHIEAIHIPCSIEEHVEALTLDISDSMYYMDEIAKKLNARDSSRVLVSRTLGKASSEMKLFFVAPEVPLLLSDSSVIPLVNMEENDEMEILLNKRASYISGQNIYGNAILANVGYTWRFPELFSEDVALYSYYRMLLAKVPDGQYKLSREAVLVAELPTAFTRSNWRGPFPKDLLSVFCRLHRLSEPIFSVKCSDSSENAESCKKIKVSKINTEATKENGSAGNGHFTRSSNFSCEVKLLSKRQDPLVECTFNTAHRKEADAIQNASLQVLVWLNNYFKQLDVPVEKLCSFGYADTIKVISDNLSRQFDTWSSIHIVDDSHYQRKCFSVGSTCVDQPIRQENGTVFNIEGPDCGVFPSPGSLTCISYVVSLVRRGESLKEPLESNGEFEFEIGTGAVINQLETCVAQMSANQSAQFTIEHFSRDLILAASSECTKRLQQLPLKNCFLEYFVKVLKVTEPLEDRMEQALFSPPLSKQRVEFAVGSINESHATTLVDFGCGSGSLLDSLMQHTTTLEKIVGVDISRKSLTRAAKVLHSKLSMKPVTESGITSAVLYDGSITDFDSRLYGFDIGTCLEVIEHMEEDQASLFGDAVLSRFCPRVLIVSTPNYEYNPILQRAALHGKDDPDLEEKSAPCKFRNGKDDPDLEEKSAPCKFRNLDHKFEWTRQQFELWATDLAKKHNYTVEFSGVGGSGTEEPGFASQMAIFRSTLPEVEKKCLSDEESSHCYEVIWEWPAKGHDPLSKY